MVWWVEGNCYLPIPISSRVPIPRYLIFLDIIICFYLQELDTDKNKGKELFKQITALKLFQPNLQVLLSIGGFEDDEDKEKYLEVVSTQDILVY